MALYIQFKYNIKQDIQSELKDIKKKIQYVHNYVHKHVTFDSMHSFHIKLNEHANGMTTLKFDKTLSLSLWIIR